MLNLPPEVISIKNQLYDTGASLVLLQIVFKDIQIYLVANEENVDWNGQTWIAFPFEIDDLGEAKRGELPSISIRVSNVTRAIQAFLEQADGGVDAEVTLFVVHSDHLDKAELIRLDFVVTSTSADSQWVTFTLSSISLLRSSSPKHKFYRNFCRFRFKDTYCQYAGSESECNKSLSRCRELDNSTRFGGYAGVGYGGIRL